jgi:hypothetical protein
MPTECILPVLCPAETGVPSRRHFVVNNRAEEHYQELVNLSQRWVSR